MNILFLSSNSDFISKSFYRDIFSHWTNIGHSVYAVFACSENEPELPDDTGCNFLCVKESGGGFIKGMLSAINPEKSYLDVIRLSCSRIKFDMIFYNTDAIGLEKVIHQIKILNNAKACLFADNSLLKNSADVLKQSDASSPYNQIRKKEKALYDESDRIYVFSENMKKYISDRNPQLDGSKFFVINYGIKIPQINKIENDFERLRIRLRHALPINRKAVGIYGEFNESCDDKFIEKFLRSNDNDEDILFVLCGYGCGFEKLKQQFSENTQKNLKIKDAAENGEDIEMIRCCEAGIVFCDSKINIPLEFETLYTYMLCSLPTVVCVNVQSYTDLFGGLAVRADAGDIFDLNKKLRTLLDSPADEKTRKAASETAADKFNIKNTAENAIKK